jgi:hypothetical protein
MKKLFLLFLMIVVSAAAVISSCSSDKKKKLTNDKAVIIVDPADLGTLIHGTIISLTGRVSTDPDAKIESWHLSDVNLGTLYPDPPKNRNDVKFTAASSGDVTGKITASYKGITKDVNVHIASYTSQGGGGDLPPGPSSTTLVLWNNGFTPESGLNNFYDWSVDGGTGVVYGFAPAQGHDGLTRDCLWYDFEGDPAWNGISFVFGVKRNLEEYNTLVCWAKGDTASDNKIVVWAQGDDAGGSTQHVPPRSSQVQTITNSGWTEIRIPLGSLARSDVLQPFTVVFALNEGTGDATKVWIDDVYLEK